MLALYEVCAESVVRYEGRVTKYSGDGVLAQFGHPVAHDDDARRAVLAGLGILEAVELRAGRWAARYGEQIRVRVGVDSGLAAVGPMFESPWSPEEIAGDPPNVATRVQSTCQPMTIRITEATNALITGWFETVADRRGRAPQLPPPGGAAPGAAAERGRHSDRGQRPAPPAARQPRARALGHAYGMEQRHRRARAAHRLDRRRRRDRQITAGRAHAGHGRRLRAPRTSRSPARPSTATARCGRWPAP